MVEWRKKFARTLRKAYQPVIAYNNGIEIHFCYDALNYRRSVQKIEVMKYLQQSYVILPGIRWIIIFMFNNFYNIVLGFRLRQIYRTGNDFDFTRRLTVKRKFDCYFTFFSSSKYIFFVCLPTDTMGRCDNVIFGKYRTTAEVERAAFVLQGHLRIIWKEVFQ